jgi:hypothetical protein
MPAKSVFLKNELGGSILMFAGTADVYENHQPKLNQLMLQLLLITLIRLV